MRLIVILILFQLALITSSCSLLTRNIQKRGTFELHGGYYKDKKWEETLKFIRYSWYSELTLAFEIYLAPISAKSPYYNWFSQRDRKSTRLNSSHSDRSRMPSSA